MIHYIDMSMTFGGMTGKKRESENLVHLWIYICVIFILTIWTCQVVFSSANLFQKLMTIIICFIEFQNLKSEKNNNRKMILDQIKRKFIEYLRDSMANEIENRVYFPSSSFIFIFFFYSVVDIFIFASANRHGYVCTHNCHFDKTVGLQMSLAHTLTL